LLALCSWLLVCEAISHFGGWGEGRGAGRDGGSSRGMGRVGEQGGWGKEAGGWGEQVEAAEGK